MRQKHTTEFRDRGGVESSTVLVEAMLHGPGWRGKQVTVKVIVAKALMYVNTVGSICCTATEHSTNCLQMTIKIPIPGQMAPCASQLMTTIDL